LSFTYNDALWESNLRDVGVAIPDSPIRVSKNNSRNRDGNYSCFIITQTMSHPQPGSDQINRACEEAWIGTNGYVRSDGTRQKRALAFQGSVLTTDGSNIQEIFVADLPDDLSANLIPSATSIEARPSPPRGILQRRLTFTVSRKFPGLQGPRHWLRSSPDGSQIAFLMKDDDGIVQLWTISPNGGAPRQLTHNAHDIASAFTWSPDGKFIAHVMDKSVCVTEMETGNTRRVTPCSEDARAPRPEACVFSPDGNKIIFVRREKIKDAEANQICVVFLKNENAAE
jgi:Tol biopolymer transport system component